MEMKKLVSTALVSGLLLLPTLTFAQGTTNAPANQPGQTQPGGQGQQGQRMKHERHPEIRRALRALNRAKMDLQKGSHDFGGHRAQALQLVDQAIQQCQQALQADKQ